jgi:DNA-directed RNA polymerase subunit RPC12/RpoP
VIYRCARCGRAIKAPAVPIEEVGGAYGPRCAALKGYMPSRQKRVRRAPMPAVWRGRFKPDPRQMEIAD